MRRIVSTSLAPETEAALARRQAVVDASQAASTLDVNAAWRSVRAATEFVPVLGALRAMAGHRERCMYCLDSHGTDVEHFWPKAPHPEHMFRWTNLLLGCAECGRFKGDRFPLDASGGPLLIDPTADDPWEHLDFEPTTGDLTARFIAAQGAPSRKGRATVELLRLDRREVLSRGHSVTFRRLCAIVSRVLASERVDAQELLDELCAEDEHGLLDWCFSNRGRQEAPFKELHDRHREVWDVYKQRSISR